MDSERWERLQSLFAGAVDLAPADRGSYLDQQCSDDPGLRLQVESLISASEMAGDFIGGAIGDTARDVSRDAHIGQRLGPYELVRELGTGGMGAVFLGRRADREYEAEVAVKLIRGLRSAEHLRRFRTERQILATLQHPNIARLLDAGTTADGVPFVVMEYVEGIPIDRYCDERRLKIGDRLALFLKVCDAVRYAHGQLVVHRDLKPANILVTAAGEPKLLDFGIAKLLEPSADADETGTAVRLMTPAYASPEQVLGTGVSMATDVYGLGVVLYELLAGRLPYDVRGQSPGDVERAICHQEPALPSVAASRPGESADGAERIAERRGVSVTRLRRRLEGDLDTILLTALQKDARRRYETVDRFAEDVERHRSGLPVLARRDTWTYRAGKFVRRHRFGVAVAAVAVFALVGFAVTMAVQAERIAEQRDAARAARVDAEEITAFLIDLFEVADPAESRGEDVTARELLDRSADRFAELAGRPQRQATLMATMGAVYQNLGVYDRAEALFDSALTVRRQTFGPEHPSVAASVHALGSLRSITGDYDSARALLTDALAMRRRLLAADDPDLSLTLDALATLESDAGNYDEADTLYREALAIDSAAYGGEHPVVASTLLNLGSVLRRKGDYDAAEPLLRQALDTRRRLLGDDHLEVGHALNQLARLLTLKGDPEAAEAPAREGLAVRRKNFGDRHIEVAASLGNLAGILRSLGRYDESVAHRRESLAILRELFGEEHPYVAGTLNSLAEVQLESGALDSAEANYRYALELHRRLLPPDNVNTAHPLQGLGEALLARGRPAEAEPYLREAVVLRRTGLPPGHQFTASSEGALGECLVRLGRHHEAEQLLLASYGSLREQFGDDSDRTSRARARLETLYEEWGRPDRAAEVLGGV